MMRNSLALLAAGCALLGASVVHAQNLPVSNVMPSSLSFTPGVGGLFIFNGTVTNNTAVTLEGALPGLALTNPVPTDVMSDTSNFTGAFGIPPIAPGGTYMGELFRLNIGTMQTNPFDLRFEVQGLDSNQDPVAGATGVFTLRVGTSAAVPEPGSVALLLGLAGSGVLLMRKKAVSRK